MSGVAFVLQTGAEKYGVFNWRRGDHPINSSTYVSAAMRHIMQYQDGVDADAESGSSPLEHAIASLIILRDAEINGLVHDDRPSAFLQKEKVGRGVSAAGREERPDFRFKKGAIDV